MPRRHYSAKTLTLDHNDPVATWPNLGSAGSAEDFVQSTAGSRPVLHTDVLNGHPGVFSDGTKHLLLANTTVELANPITHYFVIRWTGALPVLASQWIHDGWASSSLRHTIGIRATNGWSARGGSGNRLEAGVGDNDPHILAVSYNGASSWLRMDGTTVATGTLEANLLQSAILGQDRTGSGNPWIGYYHEIRTYEAAHSVEDAAVVEAELIAEWFEDAPDPPTDDSPRELPDTFTGALTAPASLNRWNKPVASAIWWNQDAARWDAVVPQDPDSDHHLLLGVMATSGDPPVSSPTWGPLVDDRTDARIDVEWHQSTRRLWVLRGHTSTTRLDLWHYDDGEDEYTLDGTIAAVTVPGITTADHDNNPTVLHRTPNGRLWAAVFRSTGLFVNVSDDDGATWLTNAVDLSDNWHHGLVGMGHATHEGTTRLVLVATEGGARDLRAFTIPQDAPDLAVGNWTDETTALPGFVFPEDGSDDHLAVRTFGNVVYAVTKLEVDEVEAGNDEPIVLLVRQPSGTWDRHTVVPIADAGFRPSRPSLAIDAENHDLYVFWGAISGGREVRYKVSSLDDLASLEASSWVVLMDDEDHRGGPQTPTAPVTSVGGLAVVVEANSPGTVWAARVPIAESEDAPEGGFELSAVDELDAAGSRESRGSTELEDITELEVEGRRDSRGGPADLEDVASLEVGGTRSSEGSFETLDVVLLEVDGSRPSQGVFDLGDTSLVEAGGTRDSDGSFEASATDLADVSGERPSSGEIEDLGITDAVEWAGSAADVPPANGTFLLSDEAVVEVEGARESAGQFEAEDSVEVIWIGSGPEVGSANGIFLLYDSVGVEAEGARDSSGEFDVVDEAELEVSGSRDSSAAFEVEDEADLEAQGSRPSSGTFDTEVEATVEFIGEVDARGSFDVTDVTAVEWVGTTSDVPPATGTFVAHTHDHIEVAGLRQSSSGVDLDAIDHIEVSGTRPAQGFFELEDVAEISWVGEGPEVGSANGSFLLFESTEVEVGGARESSAGFEVIDETVIAWTPSRESRSSYTLDGTEVLEWTGELPAGGSFILEDHAHVDAEGTRLSAGQVELSDEALVEFIGQTTSQGTFLLEDEALVLWIAFGFVPGRFRGPAGTLTLYAASPDGPVELTVMKPDGEGGSVPI